MTRTTHSPSITDLNFLYDFALSVGSSFELKENCQAFVEHFSRTQEIDYASIWLKTSSIYSIISKQEVCNVSAAPAQWSKTKIISTEHGLFQLLKENGTQTLSSSDPVFEGFIEVSSTEQGSYALFEMGDIGFVKLYARRYSEGFPEDLLELLSSLCHKFYLLLKNYLRHQNSLGEFKEKLEEEYALRRRDAEYRAVIEGVDQGVLVFDNNCIIKFANYRIEALSGFSQHQFVNQPFLHAMRMMKMPEHTIKKLSTDSEELTQRREVEITHKNGQKVWLELTMTPFKDRRQEVAGHMMMVSDITERRDARNRQEELLEELEVSNFELHQQKNYLSSINKFSSALLESQSVGQVQKVVMDTLARRFTKGKVSFFLWDKQADGLRLYASSRGRKIKNHSREHHALIKNGQGLVGYVLETQEMVWVRNVATSQWKEDIQPAEGSLICLPLVMHTKILGVIQIHLPQEEDFFTEEHLSLFQTMSRLTAVKIRNHLQQQEQRRIKRELKESELFNRLLIETAMNAVIVFDDQDRITEWNKAAEEVFGFTRDEILGKSILELIVDPNRRANYEDLKTFLKTPQGMREGKRFEGVGINKDRDKTMPLDISITTVPIRGKILYSAFIQDITKRKESEQELIEARKRAEDSSQAKELFLANMSHEIRTPMNAILGMAQLLKEETLSEKQHRYVEAINSSADNMLVVLNDILDISKIEAGRLKIEEVPFSIHQLIEKSWIGLKLKADEKGLILSKYIDEQIEDYMIGDPHRINQVLLNLLSNSIKFTERGNVQLSCTLENQTPQTNTLCIEVQDTGIGIDEEKLQYIFESFSQEDESVARRFGGTGLGLAISRELVELMGGTIGVMSKKGAGTTFTIRLTLQRAAEQQKSVPDTSSSECPSLEGIRVLMAEDNPLNQIYAEAVLEESKATVKVVENGLQAVDMLKTETFDIVLMDIQMPVMDGLEATGIVRKQLKNKLPIIALTANALKGDEDKFLKAGLNDYLPKPYKREALCRKVFHWVNEKNSVAIESMLPAPEVKTEHLFSIDKLEAMTNGKVELKNRLTRVFITNTQSTLENMELARRTQNLKQMRYLAHKLKPSLDMMGVVPAYHVVCELETLEAFDQQNVDYLFKKLQNLCQQAIREVEIFHTKSSAG